MMKLKLYLCMLLAVLSAGCTQDVFEALPEHGEETKPVTSDRKDIVLVQMGSDEEVEDISSRLYNNIPASWEVGQKTMLDYDKWENAKENLEKAVENPDIYLTVILNIEDVLSGKYDISLFRTLKFYKRDFYIIANKETSAQKEGMLSLIGVYMCAGYYAINYDNVQHYRIFPSEDPYAKENMIGKAVAGQYHEIPATNPDPGYNVQMSDREALKRIEIYNKLYSYAKGDMDYSMENIPYKMKDGIPADAMIDNSWSISAYNFQIYSKNNNCILSVTNSAGSGFSANIKDYTTPKGFNVYASIWNLMQESSSEVSIHSDGEIFREVSYQPQTVNHGTDYTETSSWNVSIGVSPTELAENPWQAFGISFNKGNTTDILYRTQSMNLLCKGQSGHGLYNKHWLFIPGEFYDKAEAFMYEGDGNTRIIDAMQATTPNYVFAGGWTLKENYLDHINNNMKLHQQQCIYTLTSDALPGIVSVTITDAMRLQKTKIHYNCGIRYGHESAAVDIGMSKTVWIDFRRWEN